MSEMVDAVVVVALEPFEEECRGPDCAGLIVAGGTASLVAGELECRAVLERFTGRITRLEAKTFFVPVCGSESRGGYQFGVWD